MGKREDYVKQAQAWIGKKEKDGSFKVIIDTYNKIKPLPRGYKYPYNEPWCAVTVSACAQATKMTDIIPCECSCNKMIDIAKKMKIWVESDSLVPKPGDIIMYDWDDNGKGDCTGKADHVGIVEKVSGTKITVIEGNKSNAVGRRTLAVNGKYIRGYICPKYEDAKTETKTETTVKPTVPASTISDVTNIKKTTYRVTASGGLYLRSTPKKLADLSNKILCMGYNRKFIVEKILGNWAYGTYTSGKTYKGWASLSYLKR